MPFEPDADNLKDIFFQHISHDIRGAYFGVGSICAIIYEKVSSGEEVSLPLAQSLMDASRHYKYLLNQFLEFSRFKMGTAEEIRYEPFDPQEEIRRIVEVNRYLAQEKNLSVDLHAGEGFPGTVVTDKWKITRIFYNVFMNALKFSPPDGRISIGLQAEPESWTLQVTDQGKGIEPERLDRLFRPFETDRSPDNPEGVGLGLYITAYLARLLEGEISVGAGPGACFTFRFPMQTIAQKS